VNRKLAFASRNSNCIMVMVGEVEAPSDENSGMRLYPRVVSTLHWV